MAGYSGYSKSNNAVQAERAGKFPATEAGRRLGLPAKFIDEVCGFASHGEWHHSSKYYNVVQYYDTNEIQAWIDGDPKMTAERGDFSTVLAGWNAGNKLAKEKPATLYSPVLVEWIEWGGTRSHPKALPQKAEGASVIDAGGKFVTVKLANGREFKKGKDSNGFRVVRPDGRPIWFR